MQQYRWQWLAFLGAVLIFVLALFSRMTTSSTLPTPPPTELVESPAPPDVTPQPTSETTSSVTLATEPMSPPIDEIPTFREALVGNVQRINPLYAALNPVDADISALIFEGLVRINEFGEPAPNLAESWVISRDALEYVFTLRTDVRWQDGIPFSAKDVVYTMSLLSDPDFDGLSEMGAFWRTVETTALNERTVRFRLTQPLAPFLTTLTVGILPEHALSGTTAADLASHPFMLTPIGPVPTNWRPYALMITSASHKLTCVVRLSTVPASAAKRCRRSSGSASSSITHLQRPLPTFKLDVLTPI